MNKLIILLIVILCTGCAQQITHNFSRNTTGSSTIDLHFSRPLKSTVMYVNDEPIILGAKTKSVKIQNVDQDSITVKIASTYSNHKNGPYAEQYVFYNTGKNQSKYVEHPGYNINYYGEIFLVSHLYAVYTLWYVNLFTK
jgi:hypothetical protein